MASKPASYRKLMVQKLTSNFREAVSIETQPICCPEKNEICVKNKYVGVNATDVNITKGRAFFNGKIPFEIGFEGVGEIVAIGEDVKNFKVGQSVAYMSYKFNSYAEYVCVATEDVFSIPKISPDYIALLVSGLTSTIGLDKSARIMADETVLITAAAGGAGHIAVQWAKAAGCHVIATCSSTEKEMILQDLGCDRIINYKKEDLGEVLAKEYPNGVNVVWETIGGKVFDDCFKNLSLKGRLLIIGAISGYRSEDKEVIPKVDLSTLPEQLLFKSAAVQGFIVLQFKECFETYFKYMCENVESGKLKILLDSGEKSTGKEFYGLEGIIEAVEHLHSGKSSGKVYVRIH